MKILIYGSNGWIGNQVTSYLDSYGFNYIRGISRADDNDGIENEIKINKPTHVLSLIGRTHGKIGDITYSTIDYLEQDGKLVENIRDNLYSPLLLAHITQKYKIHYTYLGTGCIFDTDYSVMDEFNEDSKPNFFGSSYSIVKGFTDKIVKLYDHVLNVRIRMPINDKKETRNFITKITSYEKVCSISNSMTVLPNLIPIMIDMIENFNTGTINLCNPGHISHNEILQLYKDIVDPSFEWKNFTIEEQNKILDSKRSNNILNTDKLVSLYPNVLSIKDAIINCLKLYPKSTHMYYETRLLVTGGYGFIGSNFINKFFYHGTNAFIVNIDAMYYCANINNIDKQIQESKRYVSICGNIQNKKLIKKILNQYQITHVIHFAAQSHVQNSFNDSIIFTNDNIVGTHNLLDEIRLYNKIKKIIHVSTDEVYGDSDVLKNEESAFCPTNPYAATKASAELIATSYYYSYKLPIIITRGNNVFGPNQYPEKLIPRFIQLLNNNLPVTIQGDGSCIRDFLYVDDVVNAFKIILEYGSIGEIYNIGCDDNMHQSVLDVAKLLIKKIKNTEDYDQWITYIEDRPYNDFRYYISNEKLKKLGWTIQYKFEDGIDKLLNTNVESTSETLKEIF